MTSATGYAIYKSINSGPYYFYEVFSSGLTSVKDFNHAQSAQFTCTDMGYPCTVPSSGTPSGLFARIATASGSSYTLSVNTYQSANFSDPFTPGVSGTVTVQHDDTPAWWKLYLAAAANAGNGLVQVHIPTGNYMLHPYNRPPTASDSRQAVLMLDGLSGLVFNGDGVGVTNLFVAPSTPTQYNGITGEFIDGVQGYGNSCGTSWGGSGNGFAISDPAIVGSSQVVLSTPSDSSHFTVGGLSGYLTIYDNASGYPWEFYGELDKILAVNSTTGVLTLAYPLSKTYSADLPAPYSTCTSCSAEPMAAPAAACASDITFKNMTIRGPVWFENVSAVDGLIYDHMDIEALNTFEVGSMRHQTIEDSRVLEDEWGTDDGGLGSFMNAAASVDSVAKHNTYLNPHAGNMSWQVSSEGAANVSDLDNTYWISGSGDDTNGTPNETLFGTVMGWNYTAQGATVNISNTNLGGVFGGDASYGGSGTIQHNSFYIDSAGDNGQSIVKGWTFGSSFTSAYLSAGNNQWNVASGADNLGPVNANMSQFTPVHGTMTFTQSASGEIDFISSNYYAADLFVVNLTSGDYISKINLGTQRYPGYIFRVMFIQPPSGFGGYLQDSPDCSSTWWGVSIDCSNQAPHTIQLGNNAVTILTFYDDGTTVHYLNKNYKDSQYLAQLALGNQNNSINISVQAMGTFGIASASMTGNINSIVLGGQHYPGLFYALEFTQPASGGPYTLPSDCTNGDWGAGNGIQCINGVAPVANPAASSSTIVWFYDDGTNTWVLGDNYNGQATVSGIMTGSSTTAGHTFGTAFAATPNCWPAPETSVGSWYVSSLSASSITVTYTTSGSSTWTVGCQGSGGAW